MRLLNQDKEKFWNPIFRLSRWLQSCGSWYRRSNLARSKTALSFKFFGMNFSKTVWKMEYFSFLVRLRLMMGFIREQTDLLKATPLFLKKTVRIDSASACSCTLDPDTRLDAA